MKNRALVAAAMLLLIAADRPVSDEAKAELRKLEGTWLIVSDINDGKEMPPDEAQKIRVSYAANGDWKVTVEGKLFAEGTTILDPSRKPKTLDYTVASGPERGTMYLGIYELDGDTFRHCGVAKGKGERPISFDAKQGSGRFLVTFKREKK